MSTDSYRSFDLRDECRIEIDLSPCENELMLSIAVSLVHLS